MDKFMRNAKQLSVCSPAPSEPTTTLWILQSKLDKTATKNLLQKLRRRAMIEK
jgi:hypothetical protein